MSLERFAVAQYFKTPGTTRPTAQHHIPERLKLHKHCCENRKPGVHSCSKIKGKGKVLPTTGHEGPEGE